MVTSDLIGFYVIIKIIKYVLGVVLNGFVLYKVSGCHYVMLASLWNTLAIWLLHHRQTQQKTTTSPEEELLEVKTEREQPGKDPTAPPGPADPTATLAN